MIDNVTTCRKCSSPICYITREKRFITYKCISCGFTSNSQLKEGSQHHKEFEETLPEIYKDFRFTDCDGFVWFPMTINKPGQSIVFLNGTSIEDAHWSVMLATEVLEEEKDKFKKSKDKLEEEYFKFKMDPKTIKNFDIKTGFMDALEYAGLIGGE